MVAVRVTVRREIGLSRDRVVDFGMLHNPITHFIFMTVYSHRVEANKKLLVGFMIHERIY